MPPDIEKIASDYLREDPDVEAMVGRRIVGKPPSNTDDPWVMVTVLDDGADPRSKAEYLFEHMVQFDCYAGKEGPDRGGQPEANRLYRAVRAALHAMPDVDHDGAVVSAVRFSSSPRLRDTDFKPARDRRVLTAHITTHPTEATSS